MSASLASLQSAIMDKNGIINQWMAAMKEQNSELLLILGEDKLRTMSEIIFEEMSSLIEEEHMEFQVAERPRLAKELNELASAAAQQRIIPSSIVPYVTNLKHILLTRWSASTHAPVSDLHQYFILLEQMINIPLLYCLNYYTNKREQVIHSQSRAIAELSTPVIQIWDNVLAMPLIGEIDTERAKGIMESLLQAIVETQSSNVILDITGVPIVDTGVADSLIKTVEAARLLGANCILTGIRPEVAQTIVLLGVNLGEIVTKASLRGGLAYILEHMGLNENRNKDRNNNRP